MLMEESLLMFVLTILEKKRVASETVLQKMANYQEANVKLINTQLK